MKQKEFGPEQVEYSAKPELIDRNLQLYREGAVPIQKKECVKKTIFFIHPV